MTRINAGIKPSELTRQHLLAELREIKRIPNNVSKGKFNIKNKPKEFKLGPGHVSFFYDKLLYLKKRYIELRENALERNYNVDNFLSAWDNIPDNLMNDWIPSQKDIEIVKQRIF